MPSVALQLLQGGPAAASPALADTETLAEVGDEGGNTWNFKKKTPKFRENPRHSSSTIKGKGGVSKGEEGRWLEEDGEGKKGGGARPRLWVHVCVHSMRKP